MLRKLVSRAGVLITCVVLSVTFAHAAPARAAGARDTPTTLAIAAGGQVQSDNVWEPPLTPYQGVPVGWIMLIHGGGWTGVGAEVTDGTLASVTALRQAGWGVYDVDYRPGEHSLSDVVAAYDLMRATLGSRAPICALGQSAGGHLALMLAATRPSLTCVIGEAAPTDLMRLGDESAWAPAGEAATTGPAYIYKSIIVPVFGTDPINQLRWSPISYATSIRAHILLGSSTDDWVVPQAQMTELSALDPNVQTMLLAGELTPSGEATNFPHASITDAAMASWQAAELRMLSWEASHPTGEGADRRSARQKTREDDLGARPLKHPVAL